LERAETAWPFPQAAQAQVPARQHPQTGRAQVKPLQGRWPGPQAVTVRGPQRWHQMTHWLRRMLAALAPP